MYVGWPKTGHVHLCVFSKMKIPGSLTGKGQLVLHLKVTKIT
jgi:hypothetical protein